jgi:AraC-like DNA-binding protein
MNDMLLDAARRHADTHSRDGVAHTPVRGLTVLREMMPTALQYAISKPLVAIVLQGSKRVTIGSNTINLSAGESLLITADVPTVSQITRASTSAPYLSLVIDLDPSVIGALVTEMGLAPFGPGEPVRVEKTEDEVEDAALRLMRLINRPAPLSVLQDQLIRELHFWLLSGRHGGGVRTLGITGSYAQRVARAVSMIRSDYAKTLRVEALADAAGMSSSAFHEHFRAITSLTPLQFQKQLRLIEARRMLVAEGEMISNAAYAVGYESVPQFTREYGRMFGMPPARDVRTTRSGMRSAA